MSALETLLDIGMLISSPYMDGKAYRAVHRDGYGYSRFCDLYRDWRGRLNPTMRQAHVAGEKMFVDYAGATMDENVGAIIPH